MLEENVAVFGHAASHGSVGSEGAFTEGCECFAVEKRGEVVLLHYLDFLYFVRSTEAIEEVDEGNARFDGRQVCHTGEVHYFLYGAFGKHCETGLAHRHHVLVVTENRESVRGKCTGRNMEDGRQQFAGNLVHVGNHQQEALRRGVGGGEGTGLE